MDYKNGKAAVAWTAVFSAPFTRTPATFRKADMKTLYFIGGPMGVGKTAACKILKTMLDKCVFLDGDWCWDMHPFQLRRFLSPRLWFPPSAGRGAGICTPFS